MAIDANVAIGIGAIIKDLEIATNQRQALLTEMGRVESLLDQQTGICNYLTAKVAEAERTAAPDAESSEQSVESDHRARGPDGERTPDPG